MPDPIERRIVSDFPAEQHAAARAALQKYGTESYHRERDRVLLAVLDLSKGNLAMLEDFVACAMKDYRDILFWHDNPDEARLDTEEKWQQLRDLCKKLGIRDITKNRGPTQGAT